RADRAFLRLLRAPTTPWAATDPVLVDEAWLFAMRPGVRSCVPSALSLAATRRAERAAPQPPSPRWRFRPRAWRRREDGWRVGGLGPTGAPRAGPASARRGR